MVGTGDIDKQLCAQNTSKWVGQQYIVTGPFKAHKKIANHNSHNAHVDTRPGD